MKYFIPQQLFLYNILSGGESFENILEQQTLLAEHGISFEYSDQMSDIEREIVVDKVLKREKDKSEFELEKFKAYAKIFGAKFNN